MLWSKKLAACVCMAALAGCGFQLRGSYELPFKGIFVTANGASLVAGLIRRELLDTQTKVLPTMVGADAQLTIVEERRERQILSLSRAGRVSEYELRLRVVYRAETKEGVVLIPTSEIQLKRILPYSDADRVVAKAQEEALLNADMDKDATGQILRRLIAVGRKP